ncbi:MAG: FAD:protein FMN transferase [Planctomycetota bacterium]|nr:FAD:protein FMN transferase [Planctomycetota bacterium]
MMSHLATPVQMSRVFTHLLVKRIWWLSLLLAIWGCQGPLQKVEIEHAAMGTRFRIVAYHRNPQQVERAARLAMGTIDRIENICSDWKSDSEIRQLCRTAPSDYPVKASEELIEVLSRAIEISRVSGGAFDPTVGTLVRLWRRCQQAGRLPRPAELQRARQTIGIDGIVIDTDARTVQLLREGIAIDLGGIAKGYAVDAALKVMEAQGIKHILVDGGGDISLGFPPPDQEGWRLELQPAGVGNDTDSDRVIRVVIGSRGAVATSGDASRFVEIEGKRYSHILDPATGLGVPGPHAVTVHAADGTTADALATAISVLDEKEAGKLLDRFPGSSALLFDPVGGPPRVLGVFPGYPNH